MQRRRREARRGRAGERATGRWLVAFSTALDIVPHPVLVSPLTAGKERWHEGKREKKQSKENQEDKRNKWRRTTQNIKKMTREGCPSGVSQLSFPNGGLFFSFFLLQLLVGSPATVFARGKSELKLLNRIGTKRRKKEVITREARKQTKDKGKG